MTARTSIIPHMVVVVVVVVVAVLDSDVDVADNLVVLVMILVVSVHNAMEELTATRMAIATIQEPIAILLVRIAILLLPSPTC